MWLSTARFGETLSQALPGLVSITGGSLAAAGCSTRTSISSHCLGILLQCKPSLGKCSSKWLSVSFSICSKPGFAKNESVDFWAYFWKPEDQHTAQKHFASSSTLLCSLLVLLPGPCCSQVKEACVHSSRDANKSLLGNSRHKTLPASLVWGGWLHLTALVIVCVCTTQWLLRGLLSPPPSCQPPLTGTVTSSHTGFGLETCLLNWKQNPIHCVMSWEAVFIKAL